MMTMTDAMVNMTISRSQYYKDHIDDDNDDVLTAAMETLTMMPTYYAYLFMITIVKATTTYFHFGGKSTFIQ